MGGTLSSPSHEPISRRMALWCLLACACLPVAALDPNQPLAQLHHTTWTAKDGLNGSVTALAQTADGYLWIGTTDGLFRFDGISFERYKPERGQLPSVAVSALLALPDGSLWIGYNAGGATRLKEGQATNYSGAEGFPAARVRHFIQGSDNTIWAAVVGGFTRLEGGRWRRVREEWNYPGKSARRMLVDRDGTLWVAEGQRMMYLPRGAKRFSDLGIKTGVVLGFVQMPDGSIIFHDEERMTLRAFRSPMDHRAVALPDIRIPADDLLIDRDGALWITGIGLSRIPFPSRLSGRPVVETSQGVERLTEDHGLTDNTAETLLQDREGNIWVGTRSGLERFRRRNLTWYALPHVTGFYSLVAGDQGDIWAGSISVIDMKIVRLQDRKLAPAGLNGVYLSYRDPNGAIWVSSQNLFQQWKDGVFTDIAPPEPTRKVPRSRYKDPLIASAVTSDSSGTLWLAFGGFGEFQLKNGTWTFIPILKEHPDWAARYAFTDASDRIWLVYGTVIAVMDHGRVRPFSAEDGLTVGPFRVVAGRGEQVWVGGEAGLAFLKNGRFHTLQFVRGFELGIVTGIVSPPNDGLWLSAGAGIVHVPEGEVQQTLLDPAHKVDFEVLDLESDLPEQLQRGTNNYGSGVIRGGDGMLWFITRGGVARVNPKDIHRNLVPPPVSIRSITADEKSYSVFTDSRLPALTRNLRIEYTALSLTIPQRVRFRYKLEGAENEWRDAGARREAVYGRLPPGKYTFRVIACNNDGVWNQTGATLEFSVAAAWFQTAWFYASCFLASMAVIWLLFRVRMRQVGRALAVRFDERLAERTRLARELHDTLLQTIQGSKMVADDALDGPSDLARMQHKMEQLSTWLGQATEEGRAALNSLRSSTVEQNDLAEAFRRATEAGAVPPSMTATLSVSGEARKMHPIIRDEVYRIGYEAIRNACAHSGASRLEVELVYGKALVVRVKDNGVGIDQEMAESGKEGHFGLQGMRERAARIGATFTLDSSQSSGTTITLVVPGTIVFQKPPGTTLDKLRNAIKRFHKSSNLG